MPGISSICPRCGWMKRHSCPRCRYPRADNRTEREKREDKAKRKGGNENIRIIEK